MPDSADADAAREFLRVSQRLHSELLETVLRVADEEGVDPIELANLMNTGGGMAAFLQPLQARYYERQQRQFLATRPQPEAPADASQ